MNFPSHQHPLGRLHLHLAVFATVAWALILALVPMSPAAVGAQSAVSPNLSLQASMLAPQLDLVAVHGEGFTPGGLVQLSIVSSTGVERHLWTVASPMVYGPNGSIDPMWGSSWPGTIDETFSLNPIVIYGPNGSQDPAQGYVDNRGNDEIVYGPNGSQDPAQGYVGPTQDTRYLRTCFQDLDVQAFDVQTGLMSSLVEVHPTCSGDAGPPIR